MSEQATLDTVPEGFRTPEQEQAEAAAHIPPIDTLPIEGVNPMNPHLFQQARVHQCFDRLRREDPVHLNELETAGRYWSVTRYEDIKTVSSDWETFSSAGGITLGHRITPEETYGMNQQRNSFIAKDPPLHDAQRRTVQPALAPRHLSKLEPLIRERTIRVLEMLPDTETFDWVDAVSVELTTIMLATLFDFPLEDRRLLTRWSDIVFAVPEPGGIVESHEQRQRELGECVEYFTRLWAERKSDPGDDLVSMLVHGGATRDMAPVEHLGNLLLLIIGGNDTTRNTMSGSVYALNRFESQYDKLIAAPHLIPNMVSEIIRWQTPLSYMRRTATRDCELAGKRIRKDDQLLLWYASGNRDEAMFQDGHAVDIERPNAGRHLSFGWGIHFCMGSRLAELQLRVLWEEILTRFERVIVQAEPERTFSTFVSGYTNLPVRVKRR